MTTASQSLSEPRLPELLPAAEGASRGGRFAAPITFALFGLADILLFGRESAGVPDDVASAADARLTIPIRPGLRSLNVAVAAAMALGEALRQTDFATQETVR